MMISRFLSVILLAISFNSFGGPSFELNQKMSSYVRTELKNDTLIKKFNDAVVKQGHLKGGGPIGATVGAVGGAVLVQGAYNGLLAGIGVCLTPFVTPVGAAAIVGTIRWATMPAATIATKTAALSGAIVIGVATGPI